jgi:NADPH-dependent glutamate synthase beta subunit-like oxidoreductase
MMAIGIPEYRLSKQVLRAEIDRILGLGVELRLNSALGRDFSLDDLKAQGFGAIILATGATMSQPLGIPGEELHGVWPATLFLKRVNLGENVALTGEALVVGGGSTAMDAARSAWRAGASHVTVLYRRTRQDMPAQHEEVRAAELEGVSIESLVLPVEILGRRGVMTEVRCQRLEVVGKASDGRSKVAAVAGSSFTISARNLMVAVGEAPDPSILPQGSSITFGEWGGLLTDPGTLMTVQLGVFAAGDVATGPKSVIEGVAQGQRVAWAVHSYLRHERGAPYVPAWRAAAAPAGPDVVDLDFDSTKRAWSELAGADRHDTRAEVSLGFAEATARAEARRCLRCDVVTGCQLVRVKRKVTA